MQKISLKKTIKLKTMTREEQLKQIQKSLLGMVDGYSEDDLVSFGNYILEKKIEEIKIAFTSVSNADLENWKEQKDCSKHDCCQDKN